MVYFLLILFFASLTSIIIMIGKRWAVLEHEHMMHQEEVLFELPYLKELKHATVQNAKKHSYAFLVGTIRIYVLSTNWLKNKYRDIKNKMHRISLESHENGQKKEISKFLKTIGDYKHKIREIKHKIKEEENL